MYKANRIIALLVVFLCIVLMPVLLNLGRVAASPASALDTIEIHNLDERTCVEPTEYMRSEHMRLLDDWRNEVVRTGETHYTNSSGQVYEMSLEDNCFSCHSNRAEFCDSCHTYVAVDPDCWSCHDGGQSGDNDGDKND